MRDRPHPQHKLEWPGGVVPEWAKPQQGNKRRGKGRAERQGGSSPGKRERLQKVMAQSGHGSRRNIEILIAQGHITINGQVAKLGDSVGPGDKVKLDGNVINLRFGDPLPRVLVYHKNSGEIVTRDDPQKRPTVFDRLAQGERRALGLRGAPGLQHRGPAHLHHERRARQPPHASALRSRARICRAPAGRVDGRERRRSFSRAWTSTASSASSTRSRTAAARARTTGTT